MKYICYYDIDDRQSRNYTLSAKNKLDYIFSNLEKITAEEIEIISMSETNCKRKQSARKERISDNATLRLFSSFGKKNKMTKILDYVFLRVKTLLYLLIHTQKDENVIVYHSLSFCTLISIAKKIKHFRLILELEEIYSDVSGDEKQRKKELKFSDLADAYIFPTELLDQLINTKHKPSVIIYGTYQIEKNRKCNIFKENLQGKSDATIHCVYAGTLDPRKGGAAAAAAAGYLPDCYHIHILGFGSEKQIQDMKGLVTNISSQSDAKVTYDGLLSGEDYIRFVQSCDIGLSTQDPTASFNATSFPSKILSYLANGLRVVSIKIPAIEESSVGDMLYYYTEQTPEKIADAILSTKLNDDYDGRNIVEHLHKKFTTELLDLLQKK